MKNILFSVLAVLSFCAVSIPGPEMNYEMVPLYAGVADAPLYKHANEKSALLYKIPQGEMVLWGGDQVEFTEENEEGESPSSVTWYYVVAFHGHSGWIRKAKLTESPEFLQGYSFDQFQGLFPSLDLPLTVKGYDLIAYWEKQVEKSKMNAHMGMKFLCSANPEYCLDSDGLTLPDRYIPYGKMAFGEALTGLLLLDFHEGRYKLDLLVYDRSGSFKGVALLADCHDGHEFMSYGTIRDDLSVEGIQILGMYSATGEYLLDQMTRSVLQIDAETGEIATQLEGDDINDPSPFLPGRPAFQTVPE